VVAWAARPVPTVLLLVGDYLAGMDDLPQPRWRKELIRAWVLCNTWAQNRVAKRSLTFVNSRALYENLRRFVPALAETRTTTLSAADFFVRNDTCAAPPYRLLYAGRLAPEKGLLDLVETLALLVERGVDVVLDLVGWSEPNAPVLGELHERARARGVAGWIHYHGYKPVGPALFAFYRKADLFVIASRSSFEGFPRAIWEAMAHSLPVVATRVGSIPQFAASAASLVRPASPPEMAEAIASLLHNPALRRKRVQKGLELARGNTLERRLEEMISILRDYVSS